MWPVLTFCYHGLGYLTIGSLAPGATFDQNSQAKSDKDLTSIYGSVASQLGLVLTSSVATIDRNILNPIFEKIWPRDKGQPETATTTPTWHKDAFMASMLPLTAAYISVFANNSYSPDGAKAAGITGVPQWLSATSTTLLVSTGILSSVIESFHQHIELWKDCSAVPKLNKYKHH